VSEPADADAVLVNTCGFVESAKKDSIDTLLAAADLRDGGHQLQVADFEIHEHEATSSF